MIFISVGLLVISPICSPLRAEALASILRQNSFKIVSSRDIGLALGIRAVAVKKRALPKGIPFQTGGGTTKLVSTEWVIWADAPERYHEKFMLSFNRCRIYFSCQSHQQ